MSVLGASGERDAVVIPFPAHRVRQPGEHTEAQGVADIHELPTSAEELPEAVTLQGEPTIVDTHAVLTEELMSVTKEPSRTERRAHNVSLHALATRGQSLREIELRMRSREIPEDVIAAEIERLTSSGLIDDAALASDLVERYAGRGGLGRRAVADKLRQRQLSPEIIEHALSVLSEDDELEQLREVAEARARSLTTLPADVAKRRLVAYLNRRGFSGGSVYEVAQQVLN